jgi:hypothetical protein
MSRPPQHPAQIRHRSRGTYRRHYLAEWLEARNMSPMELLAVLNEPGSEGEIDKSQVYRWMKGQLPHGPTQLRIAAALGLLDIETGEPDPELLLAHPDQGWIAERVKDLSKEDRATVKQMLDLWLSRRTGTNN